LKSVTDGVDERSDGVSVLSKILLVCGDAVGSNEEKDGISEDSDEGSADGEIDGKTKGTLEVATDGIADGRLWKSIFNLEFSKWRATTTMTVAFLLNV
jgi:hypothetical protein